MERAIIHVDMDAFFASVEVRDRPELAGRPVVVGGTPQGRGVIAAASYEARRFGVHSAMPTATALRLCPQAIVLPPRHEHYAAVSRQIHAIFERYTPVIEPLSLDEAFLDVTGSLRLFGPAAGIGREIKTAIRDELALIASVGIAHNKFLAKLASDLNKPDGFLDVGSGDVQRLLDPLPVTRLWGVGPKSAMQLERLGIRTIEQLRTFPLRLLAQHLGSGAASLLALANGRDERPVVSEQEAKSISNENTFPRDIDDRTVLRAWLCDLTEQVGWRLRRQGLRGRTIHLKIRFADFSTVTRSITLPESTDVTATLRDQVLRLYRERIPSSHPPVRLVGVGVSGLGTGDNPQPDLFQEQRQRNGRLDSLVDDIRARFGTGAVRRGPSPHK